MIIRSTLLPVALALLVFSPPAYAAAEQVAPPLLDGKYDSANPFARIIRGEIPAFKVYEDRHTVAFMDIAPLMPGHVLVVSKTSKAANLLEMDERDVARLMAVVRKVGAAQARALGVTGFTIIENNGLGQSIKQVHFHVIPRTDGGPLPPPVPGFHAKREDLEAIAAKIRTAIGWKPE